MNGNSNHYWKKSFNTTRVDVVIDDPLKILDTYITDFVSPYQVQVFDKIKDDFVDQNDESAPRMASQTPVIAPGVCGEQIDAPTLIPEIDQQYWKDRIREIPGIWSPNIGQDDTLPPLPYANCDPLGIFGYWRPGTSPFRDTQGHPWEKYFNPLYQHDEEVRDGKDYRFPYGIPPAGVEPKYINEQTGEEVYFYPPGENGHWWIRDRLPSGKIRWRFRVPFADPEIENNPNGIGVGKGWLPFEPCYGVPICFRQIPPSMEQFNPISPVQTRPFIYESLPGFDFWNNPQNNPPMFFEDDPYPYGIPIREGVTTDNCPTCPLGNPHRKKFRPIIIPGRNNEDGSPLYYPRGWDPILGPTYLSPDGEYLPVNPDFILPGRSDQETPCNPDAPGFSPTNTS